MLFLAVATYCQEQRFDVRCGLYMKRVTQGVTHEKQGMLTLSRHLVPIAFFCFFLRFFYVCVTLGWKGGGRWRGFVRYLTHLNCFLFFFLVVPALRL